MVRPGPLNNQYIPLCSEYVRRRQESCRAKRPGNRFGSVSRWLRDQIEKLVMKLILDLRQEQKEPRFRGQGSGRLDG